MSTLASQLIACYEDSDESELTKLMACGQVQWVGHTQSSYAAEMGTLSICAHDMSKIIRWMRDIQPYRDFVRYELLSKYEYRGEYPLKKTDPGYFLTFTLPLVDLELIAKVINRNIDYVDGVSITLNRDVVTV